MIVFFFLLTFDRVHFQFQAARLRAEQEAVMFRRKADELAELAHQQAEDELAGSRRAAAEAVARANEAKQRLLASMN